jgi:hypothetical protein
MSISLVALLLQAAAPAAPPLTIKIPPRAAPVTGAIGQVELGPVFAEPYGCTEHPYGQLAYAGDALGTDCTIGGGITREGGYFKPFRTDGKTNADWYGWHANVLAPCDCVVVGVYAKPVENVPGTFGKPPAAMIQFRTADGVIVVLAHVAEIAVKVGDLVNAGEVVAKVGNNGVARAPHIHIGAYREADAVPLQIRWDLRAMARIQGT